MKRLGICATALLLAACDNPGGIADSEYAKYKELGAPKILYSCNEGKKTLGADPKIVDECLRITDDSLEGLDKQLACMKRAKREIKPIIDIGYAAGVGAAVTYNKLLSDAKAECKGEFKVLDSKA